MLGKLTFPFSFTFFKYSLISSFPDHQGMFMADALYSFKQNVQMDLIINLPSPFARCKAFHASCNRSINQILLSRVLTVCQELDEGQDSMNSSECFHERVLVIVSHCTPSNSRWVVPSGRLLSWFSNTPVENAKCRGHSPHSYSRSLSHVSLWLPKHRWLLDQPL